MRGIEAGDRVVERDLDLRHRPANPERDDIRPRRPRDPQDPAGLEDSIEKESAFENLIQRSTTLTHEQLH